ncbi:MAG: hypothetical protein ACUZ8N_06510 [Candidatus Scalindua sp.]
MSINRGTPSLPRTKSAEDFPRTKSAEDFNPFLEKEEKWGGKSVSTNNWL